MATTKKPGGKAAQRRRNIPAYHQLYVILKEGIKNGQYPPGTLLPSEKALTETYDVSRVTVRRALAELVEDRVVSKHHGQGTIVNFDALSTKMSEPFSGLLSNVFEKGVEFTIKTLFWGQILPTTQVARTLQIEVGEKCLLIRRVRYVKGKPVSFSLIYLPAKIGDLLKKDANTDKLVLEMLESTPYPAEAFEFSVSASLADGEAAEVLELPVGSPVLQVLGVAYSEHDEPVYFQESQYHTDRYEYRDKMQRDRSEGATKVWRRQS